MTWFRAGHRHTGAKVTLSPPRGQVGANLVFATHHGQQLQDGVGGSRHHIPKERRLCQCSPTSLGTCGAEEKR